MVRRTNICPDNLNYTPRIENILRFSELHQANTDVTNFSHTYSLSESRHHGSRAPKEEEEIFDPEDQDEAQVQACQSLGQSHHSSKLVYSPPLPLKSVNYSV